MRQRSHRGRFAVAVTVFVGVIAVATAIAAPLPLESGWLVRKVADGFGAGLNNVAYDPVSTDLFVSDFGGHGVWRVTQSGAKTPITMDPSFVFEDLAFDPITRRIFVGGYAQTTLRVLDEFGTLLAALVVPEPYTGVAVGPGGELYVSIVQAERVLRYDQSAGIFTTFATGMPFALEGIALDAQSNLYVACRDDCAVWKYPAGGPAVRLGLVGLVLGVTCGDGSVFATNYDQNIYRVDPNSTGVAHFASGHVAVAGIHFASNGRLYVTEAIAGELWEYRRDSATGSRSSSWGRLKSRYH